MNNLQYKKNRLQARQQVFLILISAFFSNIPLLSAQDLLLFPERIVFDDIQNRVQTINLTNTGTDTTTFKISYTQARMKPDGSIETITEPDPGQRFAEPFLRVFPKTVTIAPNRSQLVKIQLTRTGDLQPGEYRSHLYFRPIPRVEPKQRLEIKEDSNLLEIKITPVYGYAIANIIKVGENTTRVTIDSLRFTRDEQNIPQLKMQLHRSGNMSCYGDIRIYHISPEGKESLVAVKNGIAVYAPGELRNLSLSLIQEKGVDYGSGRLRALFATIGNGKEVLAESVYEL